ncbi:MAG: aspartate aminotransferase family protein [Candidatus Latescibacteria bacterium]|jgi:adenosylmethionine-8-amino-7-oxononanoate aminotransferase|nr:aspartate aminotransferase family protein [Candidatus Latescibacterota bacterium]
MSDSVYDTKRLMQPDALRRMVLDLRQMETFIEDPLVITGADGVWYEDINGKRILDGISGVFVVTVGHNNRRVIDAMKAQLDTMSFAPPLHATNLAAIELVNRLADVTPDDLNTVKLLSGGSEATEAAMKLAKQYHRQTGNPNKYKIIARYQGYHGATMGALSATGTPRRKTMFEPTLPGYLHVHPPTCYRCPYEKTYPECDVFCARTIDEMIQMEGPETVAAVIVEPIGNTGGVITPPDEYLPTLRRICDEHDVLLIFDEIITGFGRTGQMFASQTFGTTPDILCMGKGMSSGYIPLAGIAFRDRIGEAFLGRDEDEVEFSHGHTYGGNPLASVAGLACLGEIVERDLPARAREMGAYLREQLEGLKDLGIIGEVRGRGLMVGVEFVEDPEMKKPFGQDVKFGVQVGKAALKKGLLTRFDPHWIAFAPPLIITREEIDILMDIFTESIKETLKAMGR